MSKWFSVIFITEDMSSDLALFPAASLDSVIRDQIHKYAGIFVSRKLSLTYEGISENVLTDEKWLEFVIGQILSNVLKYTRTGGIHIYLKDAPAGDDVSNITPATPVTLVIEDTGIGIRAEDLPRIFEKATPESTDGKAIVRPESVSTSATRS